MSRGLYVGVNGSPKKISKMYVGVGGTPHKVKKVYVGVNGVPRLVYSSETKYLDTFSTKLSYEDYNIKGASNGGNNAIFVYTSNPIVEHVDAFDKNLVKTQCSPPSHIQYTDPNTLITEIKGVNLTNKAIFKLARGGLYTFSDLFVYDSNMVKSEFFQRAGSRTYNGTFASNTNYAIWGGGGDVNGWCTYIITIDNNLVCNTKGIASNIYNSTAGASSPNYAFFVDMNKAHVYDNNLVHTSFGNGVSDSKPSCVYANGCYLVVGGASVYSYYTSYYTAVVVYDKNLVAVTAPQLDSDENIYDGKGAVLGDCAMFITSKGVRTFDSNLVSTLTNMPCVPATGYGVNVGSYALFSGQEYSQNIYVYEG